MSSGSASSSSVSSPLASGVQPRERTSISSGFLQERHLLIGSAIYNPAPSGTPTKRAVEQPLIEQIFELGHASELAATKILQSQSGLSDTIVNFPCAASGVPFRGISWNKSR